MWILQLLLSSHDPIKHIWVISPICAAARPWGSLGRGSWQSTCGLGRRDSPEGCWASVRQLPHQAFSAAHWRQLQTSQVLLCKSHIGLADNPSLSLREALFNQLCACQYFSKDITHISTRDELHYTTSLLGAGVSILDTYLEYFQCSNKRSVSSFPTVFSKFLCCKTMATPIFSTNQYKAWMKKNKWFLIPYTNSVANICVHLCSGEFGFPRSTHTKAPLVKHSCQLLCVLLLSRTRAEYEWAGCPCGIMPVKGDPQGKERFSAHRVQMRLSGIPPGCSPGAR